MINRQSFETKLNEDMGIQMNPELRKVLDDPSRDYHKVAQVTHIQTLGVTLKTSDRDFELYDNPQAPKVRSSTELTTLGTKRLSAPNRAETTKKPIDTDELSANVRLFSQGALTQSQFRSYLELNEVPITPEMSRYIKLHAETQSVPYNTLGRVVLNAVGMGEKTTKLTGDPQYKDPNSYRYLNNNTRPTGTAESREQMKSELLKQELDKLGTTYLDHKRRIVPAARDHEGLTVWKPEQDQVPRTVKKYHKQLEHHDIFGAEQAEDAPASRTARIQGTPGNGNIITWAE